MSRFRSEVLDWFDSRRVAPDRALDALRLAGMLPSPAEWRLFLGRLTLWLGTVALAAALIFFLAFNWDDLGRFAKFGLVEAAIAAGLLACWRFNLDSAPGKAVLLLLSLLTGALLALAGQVYQTGADTYELFVWWAALILPWVVVSRFSPLWLVWLGLLNLAAWLYFQLLLSAEALLWALFVLNALALAAWEAGHRAGLAWLRDEWPPRLVALASGTAATALIVWAIMGGEGAAVAGAVLAYVVWLAAICVWYRRVRPDLFMLAGGLLSLIVAVVALMSQNILGGDAGGFLLIGLVVIGMSAGGAVWLKSVAREQRA
ncbi:MAG TPA: DUF2157 domain-containing protein [Allosphingosinicella sp.]|jgi:uncharacterized membrane protein